MPQCFIINFKVLQAHRHVRVKIKASAFSGSKLNGARRRDRNVATRELHDDRIPGDGAVCLVLTGGNIAVDLLVRILEQLQ